MSVNFLVYFTQKCKKKNLGNVTQQAKYYVILTLKILVQIQCLKIQL